MLLQYSYHLPEATYLIHDVNVDDELSRVDHVYTDVNQNGEIDTDDEQITIAQFQKILSPFGVHRVRGVSLFALSNYVAKRGEFAEHINSGQVENLFEEAKIVFGLGLVAGVPKRELIRFIVGIDAKELYFENVTARVDYICTQIRAGKDSELELYYRSILAIIADCESWYGGNMVLGPRAVEAVNSQIAAAYSGGAAMLIERVAGYTTPEAQRFNEQGEAVRDYAIEADHRRHMLFKKRVLIKSAVMFQFNADNWANAGNMPYNELRFWDTAAAEKIFFEVFLTMVRSALAADELEVALVELQIMSEFFTGGMMPTQGKIDVLARELIFKARDAAIAAIYAGDERKARALETILAEDVHEIDIVLNGGWAAMAASEVAVHKKIVEYNHVSEPTVERRSEFVTSVESDLPTLQKPAIDFALEKILDSEAQLELKKKVYSLIKSPVEIPGSGDEEKKVRRPYELPL